MHCTTIVLTHACTFLNNNYANELNVWGMRIDLNYIAISLNVKCGNLIWFGTCLTAVSFLRTLIV